MIRTFLRAAVAAALISSNSQAAVPAAVPYYEAWSQSFDHLSTVSQFPHAIALDSRGNTFVTGHQIVGSAKGFYTAKYDALDGHLVWSKQLNGAGTNEFIANAVAVDSAGDCVVTGSRNVAGAIDYYTVKYSGVDGTLVWQKSFDRGNGGEDTALKVVCDSAKNVIVTGRSAGNSSGFDWVTIKYKSDDGTQLAMDSYSQTGGTLDDVPAALAVDSSNNVYVGGSVRISLTQARFYVRKLKASDLSKLWDIVPINTGDEGGVTAMAVDSSNSVVATGQYRNATNHYGYYTAKYDSTGDLVWATGSNSPVSADTFGFPRPGPAAVAIGPDNCPIVTGKLLDAAGNSVIRTIKYTSGGFFESASEFWATPSTDSGLGFGSSAGEAIAVDPNGNAIVVGESVNEDGNNDLYLAKYDATTGEKTFSTSYNGNFASSADAGVGVQADGFGNIVVLGDFVANKGTGIGLHEFGTIKLNRLIAPTNEPLPNGIAGVPDGAIVKLAGLPAIGADGALAAKLSFKVGTKITNSLLVESPADGGTLIPAVAGQPAPVTVGDSPANWVSFSDPVVAPNGNYAFAAKVSGSAAKANGVWANLNGELKLVLRQGSVIPVTGSTDKFSSLLNLGLSSNSLIALVKLAGPAATNTALLRVDNAGSGAVLLRAGQSGLIIPPVTGDDYTIKTITVFTPAPLEAGDGRWQGAAGAVARVTAVKTNDPKVKVTALVSIANGNSKTAYFYTGQDAADPVADATYSAFGYPSTATGTQRFAFKATLSPRPAASNSALVFSSTGTTYNAFAQKGVATGVIGLPATVTYADYSDPIVNTNSLVAFIATLKGTAADVKTTSNKAIVFGGPTGLLLNVARTGDFAPDSAGVATTGKWTSFSSLALPGGTNSGPIFIGKVSPKNAIGLWARDSSGDVRRLLLTGDHLGDLVVKKFTLLTAVSKSMSAARSFDSAGSVVVALTFTNNTTALLRIGIP